MSDKPLSRLAAEAPTETAPTADEVAAYLRDHPAFFADREALLVNMRLPHGTSGSVSLVERQLVLLRDRNHTLRTRLNEMVRTARVNHRLFERTLDLTLSVMGTAGTAERLRRLEEGLASGFDLDAVAIHGIEQQGFAPDLHAALRVTPEAEAREVAGNLLRPGRIICGLLREPEHAFLFADAAPEVASAAVMPVEIPGGLLLLALGSSDPNHFSPDMGTLFIRFLGDATARLLQSDTPAAAVADAIGSA